MSDENDGSTSAWWSRPEGRDPWAGPPRSDEDAHAQHAHPPQLHPQTHQTQQLPRGGDTAAFPRAEGTGGAAGHFGGDRPPYAQGWQQPGPGGDGAPGAAPNGFGPDPWGRPAPGHPVTDPWGQAPGTASWTTDTVGNAPRRRRRGAGLAALVLGAGLLGGGVGSLATYSLAEDSDDVTIDGASLGATPKGSAERPQGSVAAVANRMLPSVVSISVRAGENGGTGSGFVVRPDGYIVTNNHVVDAAAAGGEVKVTFSDERQVDARIVGRDASYDLAVLKVDGTNLPTVEFADSDAVVVGDSVIAIGSPLGLSGTVTTGIVSAKERPVSAGGETSSELSYINAIQTDAAINPGNSGGPLVDETGRVVGVNSAIARVPGSSGTGGNIGVGFAIPAKQAKRTAESLIATGKASHPIMGVTLDSQYEGPGARIGQVTSGGPADEAGLRTGDVVTAVAGDRTLDAEELIVDIRSLAPGDEVTVTYQRGDGESREATLTLVASEDD